MFGKKSCSRCGKRVEKTFEYCPYCGSSVKDKEDEQRDYGFIGKNDFGMGDVKLPLGFNTIFRKLMREMDKQLREIDRDMGERKYKDDFNIDRDSAIKQGGISINISSGAGEPVIKVKSFGNLPEFKFMEDEVKRGNTGAPMKRLPKISEEEARKLAKLPKTEASSKVRRLSGRVIYEIELPDVKDSKNIIINKLENSIEIKAFAEDKAYFKFLPVKLPIVRSVFSKGKLILELGDK